VKVAGATPGEECPKAPEAGHDMRNGSCVRTIHAEMNALAQAASRGVSVEGAAIYSTASPCWACFRVLANAGIREFFFAEEYKSGGNDDLPRIEEVAKTLNLVVRQVAE
jgi:dCMP deaminase